VLVIVLGLLLGSLNLANPAEKRRENEFLLYILTIITAKAVLTCLLGLLNLGLRRVKFFSNPAKKGRETPKNVLLITTDTMSCLSSCRVCCWFD
jgi:heme/copper-type cytochrome/quinol oxidase subunit 2